MRGKRLIWFRLHLIFFSELDLRVDKQITLKELKIMILLVISVTPDVSGKWNFTVLRIYVFI